MTDSHLATADNLEGIVAAAVADIGARDLDLLVVDHGQTTLGPLRCDGPPLAIDGTVPGRVFRQTVPQLLVRDGGERLWMPLLDGLERLGVMGLTFDTVGDVELERSRQLAALTAELLISKSLISDTLHRAARRRPLTLAAEMQWSLMPPLTAGTTEVAVAAMLEPAYEVGGDLIDYSLEPGVAHLAVFDAVGHGIQASLLSALAVGCYRNRRRAGDDLAQITRHVETAIAAHFDTQLFITAIFATLDLHTGRMTWTNSGHPAPLLLRDKRVVKELTGPTSPLLGVGLPRRATVMEEQLQPGDRVLLYTDGIVEARTPDGGFFGLERLVDFIVQAEGAAEPIPETMRRLSRALVDHHGGELRDDATLMLVEWRTGAGQDISGRLHSPPGDPGEAAQPG
ncbi:MAG: protein serine/threonine phosphatase [Solirubrobacterales bacterium]|nr:protein serine/threonine phosphatase [Solirubrobacterales bacterium]